MEMYYAASNEQDMTTMGHKFQGSRCAGNLLYQVLVAANRHEDLKNIEKYHKVM